MAYKGYLLPFERDDQGNISPAVPRIFEDLKGAFTAPKRAYQGEFRDNPAQATKEALNLSTLAGVGAFGVGSAPAGSIGMFVGRKGASPEAKVQLQLAEEMFKKGFSDKEIWGKTGWRMGPDNKWRYEISDAPAKLKDSSEDISFYGKLSDILDHPELYKQYPDLKDIPVHVEQGADVYSRGEYKRSPGGTDFINASGNSYMQTKRSLLHEIMHAIQQREGFAKGGSPSQMPFDKQFQSKNLKDQASVFMNALNKKSYFLDDLDKAGLWYPDFQDKIPDGFKFNEFGFIADTIAEAAQRKGDFDMYRKAKNYSVALRMSNPVAAKSYRDAQTQWYLNLAGEIESRLVEERMGLKKDELQYFYPENTKYPWAKSTVKGVE